MKFCSNCGTELKEGADVCLNCGKVVSKLSEKKKKDHSTYIKVSGIIMIILGICLIAASGTIGYESPFLVFTLPGIFGLVSGILSLCSSNNKNLLLVSGILYIIGAVINTIGILDVSIFGILSIVFGILNIRYSLKK